VQNEVDFAASFADLQGAAVGQHTTIELRDVQVVRCHLPHSPHLHRALLKQHAHLLGRNHNGPETGVNDEEL
jgi:hypothetical protein